MKSLLIISFFFYLSFEFVLGAPTSVSKKVNNPTAGQQGMSQADVEITRQIRRSLMENPSLSIRSKNIQIVTIQGQVTLTGEVSSIREQQEIVRATQAVAGVEGLFNQTEIVRSHDERQ